MFRTKISALAAGALIASASLFATPSIPAPAGTLLNSSTAMNVSVVNAHGVVTSKINAAVAVYKDSATGTMDFYYQVKDLSGKALPQFAVSDFTGYVTNSSIVSTIPAGGSGLFSLSGLSGGAVTDSRSSDGATVTFNQNVPVGKYSAIFLVQTNATLYDSLGTLAIQGPGGASVIAFEPAPEPGFYGSLALVIAVAVLVLHRRKAAAANSL